MKNLTLAVVLCGLFSIAAVGADTTSCPYTLASLVGNYAVTGTYGANVALALGTRTYDGKGNFTGPFIVNEPVTGSPKGDRKIVKGTLVATYKVNCDGSGTVHKHVVTNTGVNVYSNDHFTITGAKWINGQLIATSTDEAQDTPSAIVLGGVFLIRHVTRLPDIDGTE
jgi:hypothetical protein